jgi:hypothetical protein
MELKMTSDQIYSLFSKYIDTVYKKYEWEKKTIQGSKTAILYQHGYSFSFSNSEKNNNVLRFYHLTLGKGPFGITSDQLYITNEFVNDLKRYIPVNEDLIIEFIVKWVEEKLNVKVEKINKTPAKLS